MSEKESKVLVTTNEAVVQITTAWNKTVDALLETSSLLVSYSQQGNWHSIKLELESSGVMGSSVISMMLGIGNNQHLRKPEVKMLLPPSYSALYQLSKLDDDVIDVKIKNDELSPALTVEQARDWARPVAKVWIRPAVKPKTKRRPGSGPIVTLTVPWKMIGRDKAALKVKAAFISDVKQLVAKYPGVTFE